MQRKATKKSRLANTDEKAFHAWLKDQYCCITGVYGVQVHHCEGSSFRHNKVLVGHWFCIPLSVEAHDEYHGGTKLWREKYGPQSDWWQIMADKYEAEQGATIPYEVRAAIVDWGR